MRIPNAPARPKFSKALAFTTVSAAALMIACTQSDPAFAACGANANGIGMTCTGEDQNNSQVLSIINAGGQTTAPGNYLAPSQTTLPSTEQQWVTGLLNADPSSVTNKNAQTPTIAGITVVPIDEAASLTNKGVITNTISKQKIQDNGVKVVTKTVLTFPPSNGTPTAEVTRTVTRADGTTFSETRNKVGVSPNGSDGDKVLAVTNAEITAARTGGTLVTLPDGTRTYTRTTTTVTSQANVANVIGINSDDEGEYEINNEANITISHAGVGQAYGIAGNGDVESLSVTNSAKISVTRDDVIVTRLRSDAIQARPNQDPTGSVAVPDIVGPPASTGINNGHFENQNLSIAAGIFAEEELEEFSVTNTKSGTVSVAGKLAAGIYSRAGEFSLDNAGTIEHVDAYNAAIAGVPAYGGKGIAVGIVSDSGITSKAEITNTGSIYGDMLMVNGHAIRWWGLSNGLAADISTSAQTAAIQSDYLQINSQIGQLDSTIENEGDIYGNLYYSNGTHELINTGAIKGSIIIDQRNTFTSTSCVLGASGCFGTAAQSHVAYANPRVNNPSENSAAEITSTSPVTSTTQAVLDDYARLNALYSL